MTKFNEKTQFRLVWYVGNVKTTSIWYDIVDHSQAEIEGMAYKHEALTDRYTWIEYQ